MQYAILVAVLVSVVLVLSAASSQHKEDAPGAPAMPGAMPPQLKRLDAWVGTWDAEVSISGEAGSETSRGSETCRLECGGYWLVTEFKGSFMGMPYEGRGLTGFDAAKSQFSGAWVDSMGSAMSTFTNGEFSADGKTLTATVDGVGMDGQPARFEYVTTFAGARSRVFEIYRLGAGERALQMRIKYSKRA